MSLVCRALVVILSLLALDASAQFRSGNRNRDWWRAGQSFPISTTRSSVAYYLSPDDGYVYSSPANTPRETSRGVLSFGAQTNYVSNSTNVSLWDDVGTPIVTTPSDATEPFARYEGSGTVTRIEDDNASATEGKQFTFVTGAAGVYVLSCYVKHASGSTDFQLTWNSINSCSSTVTGAWQRFSCATAGSLSAAAPYSVQLKHQSSAAVGAFDVAECQIEPASFHGPPLPCGGVTCSTTADVHTTPTTGWPTASGEVELDYTPFVTSGAPSANQVILDTRTAASGDGVVIYRNTGNGLAAIVRTVAGSCNFNSTALTWATTKRIKLAWSASGLSLTADGAEVATASCANLPTSHRPAAMVGSNFASSEQAHGWVKLICAKESCS